MNEQDAGLRREALAHHVARHGWDGDAGCEVALLARLAGLPIEKVVRDINDDVDALEPEEGTR